MILLLSCDSDLLLIGLPIIFLKMIKNVFNFNELIVLLSSIFFNEILTTLFVSTRGGVLEDILDLVDVLEDTF